MKPSTMENKVQKQDKSHIRKFLVKAQHIIQNKASINNRNSMRNKLQKVAVLLIWLGIWEMVHVGVGKAVLVPSPFDTLKTLGAMMKDTLFYQQVMATFGRVVVGVGLSLGLGFILAGLSYRYTFFEFFSSAYGEFYEGYTYYGDYYINALMV